jgi:polar amino acid transport system permease protein
MAFDWGFFWHYLLEPSSVYLHGLWLTLSLSVISQSLGIVIGLFAALGRLSRFRLIQTIVGFYVWVMRGTPLLVQIVFIYTGLAAGNIFRFEDIHLGFVVIPGNIQAAIVALSLNEGAYMSEIIGPASLGGYRSDRGGEVPRHDLWQAHAPHRLPQAAR